VGMVCFGLLWRSGLERQFAARSLLADERENGLALGVCVLNLGARRNDAFVMARSSKPGVGIKYLPVISCGRSGSLAYRL
jgi:hypothetical protein